MRESNQFVFIFKRCLPRMYKTSMTWFILFKRSRLIFHSSYFLPSININLEIPEVICIHTIKLLIKIQHSPNTQIFILKAVSCILLSISDRHWQPTTLKIIQNFYFTACGEYKKLKGLVFSSQLISKDKKSQALSTYLNISTT